MNLISKETKSFFSLKNPILWAFLISVGYWTYLFFTASMEIRHDSISYESLGRLLYQQGWVEFFKTGPQREPFYPLIVAFATAIGDTLTISYQKVLALIQFTLLFLTQILTFAILKKLEIRNSLKALTIAYMGLSPALVNSALSVYSEIATYPFVLGIILLSTDFWKTLPHSRYRETMRCALFTGLLFLPIIFTKGVWEYVLYVYCLFFMVPLLHALVKRNRNQLIHTIIFPLIVFMTCQLALFSFKSMNKKHNGLYVLTNTRGFFSLYASAARRTEPMYFKRILAGIAFTAGEGCCNSFFSQEECYFWSIYNYDSYGYTKLSEVGRQFPKEQVNAQMVRAAKDKIFQKPFQFTALMFLEWVKMFFWESTKIGFVRYPPWLSRLFDFGPFKNALRLVISCACLLSFLYLLFSLLKRLKHLFAFQSPQSERTHILIFISLLLMAHIGFYAIFMTIPRFSFPVVSLQLLSVAWACENLVFSWKTKRS